MVHLNTWISISALLAGISVILGAFGAHGLESRVNEQALSWFRTASSYQMVHALGLLGWALWMNARLQTQPPAVLGISSSLPAWGFCLGTVFFSGSLYAMTLGAPRWFGAITPIGGTLWITSWFIFSWQAFRN